MTVYVDDMHLNPLGQLRHLHMCHMIADSESELQEMADRIGVARGWHHKPGTARSHYDIDTTKRILAIQDGAIEITMRECAAMTVRRGVEGVLGTPAETMAWWKQRMRSGG